MDKEKVFIIVPDSNLPYRYKIHEDIVDKVNSSDTKSVYKLKSHSTPISKNQIYKDINLCVKDIYTKFDNRIEKSTQRSSTSSIKQERMKFSTYVNDRVLVEPLPLVYRESIAKHIDKYMLSDNKDVRDANKTLCYDIMLNEYFIDKEMFVYDKNHNIQDIIYSRDMDSFIKSMKKMGKEIGSDYYILLQPNDKLDRDIANLMKDVNINLTSIY